MMFAPTPPTDKGLARVCGRFEEGRERGFPLKENQTIPQNKPGAGLRPMDPPESLDQSRRDGHDGLPPPTPPC